MIVEIESFGEIQQFINGQEPVAKVVVFELSRITLLKIAGNPCRDILKPYQQVDVLSRYIHVVQKGVFHTRFVPISKVMSRVDKRRRVSNYRY